MKGKVNCLCCCCGRAFTATYDGLTSKAFAEVCDVCPDCFKAGCKVLTGSKCNVTGKPQYQLAPISK